MVVYVNAGDVIIRMCPAPVFCVTGAGLFHYMELLLWDNLECFSTRQTRDTGYWESDLP